KLAEITNERLGKRVPGIALVKLDRSIVEDCVTQLMADFDPLHGGFGRKAREFGGPKFPTPCYLLLLQHEVDRAQLSRRPERMTLQRMSRGGIFDQIGGGSHRYSTERTWTVPHFEKMLYDQAQLAEAYSVAFRRERLPEYERALRMTLDFVLREMTAPEGGFYSALDADSEGEEGRFYVWTAAEIEKALPNPEERKLAAEVYGFDREPNFEQKYYIPTFAASASEKAA